MIRKDREHRKGGGVAILIKTHININCIPFNTTNNKFEILWVQLIFKSSLYYICAIYHPPSPLYDTEEMLNYIEDCIQTIVSNEPQSRIILAGDFNTLPDQIISDITGLINIVNKPTRGPNFLDKIYVSGVKYLKNKVIDSLVNSDHKAIVVGCNKYTINLNKTKISHQFRDRSPKNIGKLREFLTHNELPSIENCVSVQKAFDEFYNYTSHLIDTFFPIRTITTTSSDPIFVTPYIKYLLRKKNKLMRRGKLDDADAISKQIRKLICCNKSTAFKADILKKPKEMWSLINKIIKPSSNLTTEFESDHHITATNLNCHYANVSCDNNYKPPKIKNTVSIRGESFFKETDVHKSLTQLKRTATGYDGMPYWFLKLTADFIYVMVTQLFNMSVNQGVIPQQWKKAEIHPIPKIQQPKELKDYRPISITPVLSRVAEKIVTRQQISRIYSGSYRNDFEDQFAFRPGGSTTAAVIAILHIISNLLDKNQYVRLIALDFSKAFDTICHYTLFDKLSKYDIPDAIYNWMVNYFDQHSHRTKFNDQLSDFANTNAGVIQGSALGPHCFTVVAADLKPLYNNNKMIKYADDTYLIIPEANINTTIDELANIESWSKVNNLRLNITKSIEVIFKKPRSSRNSPPRIENIERHDNIKILGVHMNSNLSCSEHVNFILKRAFVKLQCLKILRSYGLDGVELDHVFHSLVQPYIIYASQAWHGFINSQDLNRIQSFFRRCHKWGYCKCNNYVNVRELFKTLDSRLIHKILNNKTHTLFNYLPSVNTHYTLRNTSFNLPTLTTIKSKNFIYRTLFNDHNT